ncbi:MAG: sigma-54 dependent transcriptional regulator [Pseudomonadota bacterium]
MIDLISAADDREAQRIQAGLDARGFQTRRHADPQSESDGIQLVHVATLRAHGDDQPLTPNVIAFGGSDSAADAVSVLRLGAVEYLPTGASIEHICQSLQRLLREQGARASATPAPELVDAPAETEEPAAAQPVDDVAQLCASEAMQRSFALAERVAQADIAVMVSGPSGTGKEVVAQYIHRHSPRRNGPFIALNCAAIPETMLEALLFGHDKGAFTGATEKRMGKFEMAHGGTLLLDEITEMPVSLQAKLLRVLQEKEVERIGSNQPRKVDVRVIATSNRNLRQAVSDGVLREDLYYRLSVFPIELPALGQRVADILPLAQHFLTQYGARPMRLSESAQTQLLRYAWPGNVRELENCIQRAVVLCETDTITPADLALDSATELLPALAAEGDAGDTVNETPRETLADQVRSAEEQLLLQTLSANNGVRKTTAVELGISERTLRYKLKQLRDRGVLA